MLSIDPRSQVTGAGEKAGDLKVHNSVEARPI